MTSVAKPALGRSGRAALVLATALLALGAALLVWRLAGSSGRGAHTERPPASGVPSPASATMVAPTASATELQPTERLAVAPLAEPPAPPPASCRLEVLVLPPQADGTATAFEGTALVHMVRAEGAFERTLEVAGASPRAELQCPPGEYEFTLVHRAHAPFGALPIRAVLSPDSNEHVTLALVPLRALAGQLSDEHGKALAGVPIALQRRGRTASETRSAEDGRFAFPPLPAGDYALVVGDPLGPLAPPRPVDLGAWTGEMPVSVPALLELEVRVVDATGRAVSGAHVEGAGASGGRVSGDTDRRGRLLAARLPPGSYRLTAIHPTLGRGSATVELGAATRAPLEIRLGDER